MENIVRDSRNKSNTEDTPIRADVSLDQHRCIDELHTAIKCNNLDAVETLLDNHAILEAVFVHQFKDEHTVQNDVTPLMLAAESGHREIVELLLKRGVNIYATTDTNLTALHLAVQQGHESIVEILSDRGGTELLEMTTIAGRTSLLAASCKGYASIVRLLLDKGADIDAMEAMDQSDYKEIWEIITQYDTSAFTLAAQGGHVAALDVLLSRVSTPKFEDAYGTQALHSAVQHGQLAVVEYLLKDHIGLLNSRGAKGRTAISAALEYGHADIFEYLLNKDADLTIDTTLQYAVMHRHLGAVEKVLTKQPILLDSVDELGTSAICCALTNDHLDIFNLLIDMGADLTTRDYWTDTVLHHAARRGHLSAVKKILAREPSLLNLKGRGSQTGLISALWSRHLAVAKYLIQQGADVTLEADFRHTALYLACHLGYQEISQLILKSLTFDRFDPHYIKTITVFDKRNPPHDTVLMTATTGGRIPIVFQLLEAGIYFPRFPAKADPFWSCIEEASLLQPFLSELVDRKSEEINEHGETILYWAILNRQEELFSKCMGKIQSLRTLWERGGASWAHVAALGGHTRILEQLLLNGLCTLAPTDENITPLHLAVKYGHIELVRNILVWLGGSPTTYQSVGPGTETEKIAVLRDILHEEDHVLGAIIRKQYDGHTPISLAALGTTESHRQMEVLLWQTIDNYIEKTGLFFKPLNGDAKLVLELAAQFEAPGEETYLSRFLQSIPRSDPSETGGLDAFHLAVYHKLPIVVWWLLSNGWYLSGNHIEKGQQIISKWEQDDPVGNIMKEILENPPPLRDHHAWRYDENQPTFQFSSEDYGLLEGTVLDLYHEEHQASIQLKRRSMAAIIYDEGPQKIMKPGRYLDLDSLKGVLSTLGESSNNIPNKRETTAVLGMQGEPGSEKQRVPDLRWIHVPANNLRCVEELMIRLSQDRQIKNKDHRPWAQFVRKSWAELPAGGNTFYMKPQCLHYKRSDTAYDGQVSVDAHEKRTDIRANNKSSHISNFGRSALYMPYLFWKKCPVERPRSTNTDPVQQAKVPTDTQNKMTHSPKITPSTQGRHIVHDSMTLDQYYYSSLEDTTTRDKDQVLWRSTDPKLKQAESKSGTGLKQLDNQQANDYSQPKDDIRKILIVNQLWLWVLDEKTIITSTTNEIDKTESSFLQRVLNNLRAQEKSSSILVENIQELILSTATSFFNKKDVEVLGNKKSPLGVYRAAILNVRDKEAHLFDVFQKSLGNTVTDDENQTNTYECTNRPPMENKEPGETHDTEQEAGLITRLFNTKHGSWKGRETYNPYGDIAGETELLREVKDICDELNMMKSLALDQESVWKQIWKDGSNPDATFTYNTPSEVKKEITEMVKEAEFVQKAIDMLLDLKQKQANIVEAEFARKQSEDTAKQSDTIMVFTVVTILFLPASFLTSLLALDISDFPHVGDDVRFEGRMIFPIIFGVSILVSGFFAVIAYNASTLKEYAFGRRESQKRNIPTNLPAELELPNIRQPKLQIEQLREQLKLDKETKKEDGYGWSVSGGDHIV